MAGIIKKVQGIQTQLENFHSDFENQQFSASIANSAVTVTVSGNGTLNTLKISPEIINPANPKILEDMICLATRNAQIAAKKEKTRLIENITGDLPLPPGMGLPI
jgi:hypothetical protein